MPTVYQSSRNRIMLGIVSAVVLHLFLLVIIQLLDVRRPVVPEYSEIVYVELSEYAPADEDEISPQPEDQPSDREPAADIPETPEQAPASDATETPQASPDPAPEPDPAPDSDPQTPPEEAPSEPEEQLEFEYQQEVPDATLRQPDSTTREAEIPAPGSAIGPPSGPTEAEIALRRENLEALQDWLDSQPDLSAPVRNQTDDSETQTSAISPDRLREIDRALAQLTGPDQQVRSINIPANDSGSTEGTQGGDVPRLSGDRVRISGEEPRLDNTLLGPADPPILTAMVSFVVNSDGRVVDLQFEKSSGNNEIDARIRSAVRSWRFTPAPGTQNARGEITYTIRRVQ
ncbi:MAG: energy transducer TonB [Spirochaeta sp.]